MIKFLEKIQNLGIDFNTDLETAQRIRLANKISIVAILYGFLTSIYAYLAGWLSLALLLIMVFFIVGFTPLILNYFKKSILSRISFLIAANIFIICLVFISGKEFHFQYFLVPLIALSFVLFGNEIGNKKLIFSISPILIFIYLEWHFITFGSSANLKLSNIYTIRFVNELIIFIVIFLIIQMFVTENEKHIGKIKAKSNELEEKSIELEHFAYIASHDLNEPLRTVNSFVEIIKEEYEDTSDKNLTTYFSFINDALARMRLMIDGLLNYSRIGKSGTYTDVDLNLLITEIKQDLEHLLKEDKGIIQFNNLPVINCLPMEIRELFQNLITNAIKFQPPHRPPIIKITQEKIPNYWLFCIADNGIGINPKKKEEIFQMFTSLHLSSKYNGQGIGLAFCKKIVEIHQGKIWVESTLDNGSRFYFTIKKVLRKKL